MKNILPSNRAQGALALFVLLIALIVGAALFGNSIVDARQTEAEARAAEVELLQRRVRMPIPAPATAGEQENVYLEGENYALAVNALQQRVVSLIEEANGKLVTVAVDPAESTDQGVSRRAALQIAAELDNDGLQSLLYQLEAERPVVMVDSLNVRRAVRSGQAEGEAQAQEHEAPRLTVDLRVVGFYRKAGP
jgi:hypothetical protein